MISHLASVAVYCCALTAGVGAGLLIRSPAAPLFLLWAAICEWTGVLLVAALASWLLGKLNSTPSVKPPGVWFSLAQVILIAAAAVTTGWIAFDLRFEGMGDGIALFGLSGRRAAPPAALMLLGASILMAWQTHGPWRVRWQFASMGAGLLFTTTIGWSGIASNSTSLGFDRALTLSITASMMTMMSGWGLGRGLPEESDWLSRGKEASPYFAALAACMLAVTVALW